MLIQELGTVKPGTLEIFDKKINFDSSYQPAPGLLVRFDNLDECIDYCDRTKDKKFTGGNPLTDKDGDRGDEGTGCTYDEARHMAQYGWPEGLKRGKDLIEAIESRLFHGRTRKIAQEYAVTGGCPDVGVALTSDPESFLTRRYESVEGQGKLARLRISCICSWCVSPATLFARGMVTLAALDALERNGISTEIDIIVPGFTTDKTGRHMYHTIEIPLKASNTVSDDDRVAFCLGHPGFMRRYLYRSLQAIVCEDNYHGSSPMPDIMPQPGDIQFPSITTFGLPYDFWNKKERMIEFCIGEIEKKFKLL